MTEDDVADLSLTLPDGRTMAWTETGPPDGSPILRVPGLPGSRWTIRADRQPWYERSLRVVTTERPGFGRSTRLPGRGFAEHAHDLAFLLDHLGIDRVPVYGASGAAPHILALAAHHGDRVRAVSIIAGAAPITPAEAGQMIPINISGHGLGAAGDVAGLRELLDPVRDSILADPLASFAGLMETAPAADLAVMGDPLWRETFARAVREAMAQGVDGWIDEILALSQPWSDIDLSAVLTSVTWYHSGHDRNAPFPAAQRLVNSLPNARLVIWSDDGHLIAHHHEAEILDELLAR